MKKKETDNQEVDIRIVSMFEFDLMLINRLHFPLFSYGRFYVGYIHGPECGTRVIRLLSLLTTSRLLAHTYITNVVIVIDKLMST